MLSVTRNCRVLLLRNSTDQWESKRVPCPFCGMTAPLVSIAHGSVLRLPCLRPQQSPTVYAVESTHNAMMQSLWQDEMIFNYQKYNKLAPFTLSLLCSHPLYLAHTHIQRLVTFKYSIDFRCCLFVFVHHEATSFVASQFNGLRLTQSSCISSAAHTAISYL